MTLAPPGPAILPSSDCAQVRVMCGLTEGPGMASREGICRKRKGGGAGSMDRQVKEALIVRFLRSDNGEAAEGRRETVSTDRRG